MGDASYDEVTISGQVAQQVKQRHRVGPARERRYDPGARRPQIMACDVAPDPPKKCGAQGVRLGL